MGGTFNLYAIFTYGGTPSMKTSYYQDGMPSINVYDTTKGHDVILGRLTEPRPSLHESAAPFAKPPAVLGRLKAVERILE